MFRRDCGYFEIECPEFPSATELKDDLEKYESMWGILEAFNLDLAQFRKEDWISFRFSIHPYFHYKIISHFRNV